MLINLLLSHIVVNSDWHVKGVFNIVQFAGKVEVLVVDNLEFLIACVTNYVSLSTVICAVHVDLSVFSESNH